MQEYKRHSEILKAIPLSAYRIRRQTNGYKDKTANLIFHRVPGVRSFQIFPTHFKGIPHENIC